MDWCICWNQMSMRSGDFYVENTHTRRKRAVIAAGKWDKMWIFYQDYCNVFQKQKLNSHFIAIFSMPFRNENPVKCAIWAKFAFLKCLFARRWSPSFVNFNWILHSSSARAHAVRHHCSFGVWWAHTPRNQIDTWPHKL